MEVEETPDDVEKKLKLQLLAEESSDCVCCKALEKSFFGWRPFQLTKECKKRCETTRVSTGNQGSLRREKTILAATGDFLFRHYESPDRYMAQYRENHSTSCMEREISLMPVLGVDVPDPYFPKISTSSALMDRIKIIEALSDFYTLPKDTRNTDVKNICLTGKKADPTDRRYLPPTPKKSKDTSLPALIINSAGNINDTCLPTLREGEDEEDGSRRQQELTIERKCPEISKNDCVNCVRFENNKKEVPKTNFEKENKAKKESFVLAAAKLVCNDRAEKERLYLQTALPRIPLWTEYEPNKERQRKEMVLETLRIGKKCKNAKKGSLGNQVQGERLNLRSNLDKREGIPPPSRGNLRLGTTVRPSTNQKDTKRKINVSQTAQNKYDLYSNSYLSRPSHSRKKSNLPSETTFIKILGNQTVATPSKPVNTRAERKRDIPKTKTRSSKEYQGIPLGFLRKFGRHNFNHVLEARSYKPETRKLGSTIIPN